MPIMTLPDVAHDQYWDAWHRRDDDWWLPTLSRVAAEHGFATTSAVRAPAGRNVVVVVGDRVVKLVPPFWAHMWECERRALDHVFGRLSVRTP